MAPECAAPHSVHFMCAARSARVEQQGTQDAHWAQSAGRRPTWQLALSTSRGNLHECRVSIPAGFSTMTAVIPTHPPRAAEPDQDRTLTDSSAFTLPRCCLGTTSMTTPLIMALPCGHAQLKGRQHVGQSAPGSSEVASMRGSAHLSALQSPCCVGQHGLLRKADTPVHTCD